MPPAGGVDTRWPCLYVVSHHTTPYHSKANHMTDGNPQRRVNETFDPMSRELEQRSLDERARRVSVMDYGTDQPPAAHYTVVSADVPAGVDPKGAVGATKLPLGALPWAVVLEASCGLGEGMVKYGPHNWRTSGGVESMTYVSAAMRHLTSFITGEDVDPDSSLSHITKAISTLMVLRDAQLNGTAIDNRPPPVPAEVMAEIQTSWARVRPLAQAAAEKLKQ